MGTTPRIRTLVGAVIGLLVVGPALAQFGWPRSVVNLRKNIAYDGRFTFVRVNYTTSPGGYFYRGEPAWAHGYPLAEQNLMAILNEVSFLGPHIEGINSLRLDDPELSKLPRRVHHRARLVVDDRQRGPGPARVPCRRGDS